MNAKSLASVKSLHQKVFFVKAFGDVWYMLWLFRVFIVYSCIHSFVSAVSAFIFLFYIFLVIVFHYFISHRNVKKHIKGSIKLSIKRAHQEQKEVVSGLLMSLPELSYNCRGFIHDIHLDLDLGFTVESTSDWRCYCCCCCSRFLGIFIASWWLPYCCLTKANLNEHKDQSRSSSSLACLFVCLFVWVFPLPVWCRLHLPHLPRGVSQSLRHLAPCISK